MKTARPEDKALNANEQKTPPENGKGAANLAPLLPRPALAPRLTGPLSQRRPARPRASATLIGRSWSKLSPIRSPACSLTDSHCALNLP